MRIFSHGGYGFRGLRNRSGLIDAAAIRTWGGLVRIQSAASLLVRREPNVRRSLEDLDSLPTAWPRGRRDPHAGFNQLFLELLGGRRRQIGAPSRHWRLFWPASARPFIVTSGTALAAPGRMATRRIRPIPPPAQSKRRRFASGEMRARLGAAPSFPRSTAMRSLVSFRSSSASLGEKGFRRMWGRPQPLARSASRRNAAQSLQARPRGKTPLRGGPDITRVADEACRSAEIAQVIVRRLNIPVVSKSHDEAHPMHFGQIKVRHTFSGLAVRNFQARSNAAQKKTGTKWRPTQLPYSRYHRRALSSMKQNTIDAETPEKNQ